MLLLTSAPTLKDGGGTHDGIGMEDKDDGDERRRSPRFNCGGEARISCLPSNGVFVSGRLRNLSAGGICVDVPQPLDLGARAELVLSVNAAKFRTLGLVKSMLGDSRACMEFIQVSPSGQVVLADLVAQFARLQGVLKKLRSDRTERAPEVWRQLQEAGLSRLLFDKSWGPVLKAPEGERGDQEAGETATMVPVLINVDLFA